MCTSRSPEKRNRVASNQAYIQKGKGNGVQGSDNNGASLRLLSFWFQMFERFQYQVHKQKVFGDVDGAVVGVGVFAEG